MLPPYRDFSSEGSWTGFAGMFASYLLGGRVWVSAAAQLFILWPPNELTRLGAIQNLDYRTLVALALVTACGLAGCRPPSAPLYYDVRDAETADRPTPALDRIEEALIEAGWTIASTARPGAIATEERTLRRWGLYRIVVSLEALPLGDKHVRVFIHPYRRFATGGQSKPFAIDRPLRESLLEPVEEALFARGFEAVHADP